MFLYLSYRTKYAQSNTLLISGFIFEYILRLRCVSKLIEIIRINYNVFQATYKLEMRSVKTTLHAHR